jgi:dimethylargininase
MTGSQRVLVRPPGARLADGLVTHIDRSPIDLTRARQQWCDYVDTLANHGWTPVEVAGDDDLPDAVFIEDALVMFDDLAVVTAPGAVSRRPETTAVATVVADLGYEVRTVDLGTLDGGDVLKVGRTAYVGIGGRTTERGVAALAALVEPRGWTVVGVPITKVLHLKSAVTALPDGTVIGFPPVVDDESVYGRFLDVDEEPGAHVVLLGGPRLLMASSAERTAARFAEMGYEPVLVDISEYEKLEGCVTCLSVRLR